MAQGIDCQRCHDDGRRHADLASWGATIEQVRAAIVNPVWSKNSISLKTRDIVRPVSKAAMRRYEPISL